MTILQAHPCYHFKLDCANSHPPTSKLTNRLSVQIAYVGHGAGVSRPVGVGDVVLANLSGLSAITR